MPVLIDHIDAIPRRKQRDVLSIRFVTRETDLLAYDYLQNPERLRVISWLDEHGVAWQPCERVSNDNYLQFYIGDIYVDVPFKTDHPTYQLLQTYLENPDRPPSITLLHYNSLAT